MIDNMILFHDKTKYDEKVAHMVTDYVNIGKRMSKFLEDAINTITDSDKKKALQKEYEEFLHSKAKSMTRDGKERIYDDLLKGHFEVEVIRIERSEDHNTDIYGKAFDFSRNTIEKLKEEGEKDTENILNNKYPNLSW
jgi:NTE family protein